MLPRTYTQASRTGPAFSAVDDDDFCIASEAPTCRICFDNSPDLSPLISPCSCKGSQEYVHVHCLRKWQSCVLDNKFLGASEVSSDKAYRCGVCLTKFSLPPIRSSAWSCKASRWIRAVLGLACLSLLVAQGGPATLSACAWQHALLLALLFILGSRSQPVMTMLLLLVLGSLGAMYSLGLRISKVRSQLGATQQQLYEQQEQQGFNRPGLNSSGSPSDLSSSFQLQAGMLLVASRDLTSSIFRNSVVLILRYSTSGGAEGVILNTPIPPTQNPPLPAWTSSASWNSDDDDVMHMRDQDPDLHGSQHPNRLDSPGNARISEHSGSRSAGACRDHDTSCVDALVRQIEQSHPGQILFRRHAGGPVGFVPPVTHRMIHDEQTPASPLDHHGFFWRLSEFWAQMILKQQELCWRRVLRYTGQTLVLHNVPAVPAAVYAPSTAASIHIRQTMHDSHPLDDQVAVINGHHALQARDADAGHDNDRQANVTIRQVFNGMLYRLNSCMQRMASAFGSPGIQDSRSPGTQHNLGHEPSQRPQNGMQTTQDTPAIPGYANLTFSNMENHVISRAATILDYTCNKNVDAGNAGQDIVARLDQGSARSVRSRNAAKWHAVVHEEVDQVFKVVVYHGRAVWGAGQLEAEVKRGAWALTAATPADLEEAIKAPEGLWSGLLKSGRLVWS